MVIGYVIWLYYDMIWYDMVLKQTKHIKSISLWISDHIKSEYWTISHIEPMKLSSMQSAFEYLPVPQTAKHRFWFVDWMWIQHQTQHQIMILLNLWTTRSYNFQLKTQKFQHDTHTLEELSTESFDHLLQGSTEYTLLVHQGNQGSADRSPERILLV